MRIANRKKKHKQKTQIIRNITIDLAILWFFNKMRIVYHFLPFFKCNQ